jgi:hypothetical protein
MYVLKDETDNYCIGFWLLSKFSFLQNRSKAVRLLMRKSECSLILAADPAYCILVYSICMFRGQLLVTCCMLLLCIIGKEALKHFSYDVLSLHVSISVAGTKGWGFCRLQDTPN